MPTTEIINLNSCLYFVYSYPKNLKTKTTSSITSMIHLSLNSSKSPTTTMPKSIIFFLLTLFTSTSSSNPNPLPLTPLTTAHSVLTRHGFPVGLLPTDVLSYHLNRTSGDFSVDLGRPCRLILPPDNYLATYSKKVTGKIVENRIAELSGIRVRAFFQWWGITGIKISGDDLVFEVGMVTAKYPSKNFDEIPQCEGKKHSSS